MKIIEVGFNSEGKVVEDLKDAVFLIQSKYDDDGNLLTETFLQKEGLPLVLPTT